MKLIYTVSGLVLSLFFVSCSTPEAASEQGSSPKPTTEVQQEQVEPTLEPDWFAGEAAGVMVQGRLAGYASAPGSDPDWIAEGLFPEAERNLVRWIDDELELMRRRLVDDGVSSLADPTFIRTLRKAVWTLDFEAGERQEEGARGDDGVYYHFVRLEIPVKELWDQLEQTMEDKAPEQWVHFRESPLFTRAGE
ncbi:MAG: hypothetical protein WD315_01855 [Balneolaceae bacterium]